MYHLNLFFNSNDDLMASDTPLDCSFGRHTYDTILYFNHTLYFCCQINYRHVMLVSYIEQNSGTSHHNIYAIYFYNIYKSFNK